MYLDIVYIILGIVLLMLGRKLFWLFAGAIAFIFAVEFIPLFLHGQSQHVIWIIALVLSIIAVILSFVTQKIGLGVAGFMAGGYVAMSIVNELGVTISWLPWVLFAAGGIIGLVLTTVLFNWALILLSSLSGAFLIVQVMGFSLHLTKILFILLVAIGIVAQAAVTKSN
ncbi:MAG: TMEM198/TM7SF3 family protein [Candidatus Omnitrophica bacterium]|nr:TMEM198/TM7SF3 family protein [Candidatus Omnitrophota bacterium]